VVSFRRIILPKDKFGSIQWVIDALYTEVKEKTHRRPRETDEIRADRNLSWCPECKRKWNMFEGRLWASPDVKLWKEKICPRCDSLAE
tara:strand:+ start:168 stop:431 length:264 start_codon:yes stop_codon:yes gene_type:complete